MIKFTITRKPVEKAGCPKCRRPTGTAGVLCRVTLSRLEEGLGHEGFKCNACDYALKYVPRSN